jgi:hypothetical protein
MPAEVMDLLARYRQQQAEYAKSIGNHWVTQISGLHDKMVDNDRLFTQWNEYASKITRTDYARLFIQ